MTYLREAFRTCDKPHAWIGARLDWRLSDKTGGLKYRLTFVPIAQLYVTRVGPIV
jgi:hypothetical protein